MWPGMDRDPTASITTLFSAKAEVHTEVEPALNGARNQLSRSRQGYLYLVGRYIKVPSTFGRSFHAYPGMSPGFSVRNHPGINLGGHNAQ
jgi:hypothetical protein